MDISKYVDINGKIYRIHDDCFVVRWENLSRGWVETNEVSVHEVKDKLKSEVPS